MIIGNDLKTERTFLKRRPDFEGFFFGVGSLREIGRRGDFGEGMDFGDESEVIGDGVLIDLRGDGGAIFFPPLLGKDGSLGKGGVWWWESCRGWC